MAQPELRHLLADCIQIIVDHGDDPELLMLRQQLQTFVDRLDQLDGESIGQYWHNVVYLSNIYILKKTLSSFPEQFIMKGKLWLFCQ